MPARSRIASIDVMRGLVMVIMLMDHVREAIYRHLQVGDPMNVATTAPDLFFTGAPMFFYLLHLYTLLVLYRAALALFGPNHGDRFGVDQVWWIWVIAASLACALYFPCRAFTQFKRRSSQAWVRYF
jgi:uncharacterized membrane protein